jgi:putative two-component system response regulator
MYLKLFKQNKVFLVIVLLLFFVVGFVVYVTASQIYELEISLQEKNEKARLQTAKEVIEVYFSELGKRLRFLSDLKATGSYVDSGFSSDKRKSEVEEAFYELAAINKDIYQVSIIDLSGNEVVKVINRNDGNTNIASASELENRKNKYFFRNALKLEKNNMYVCSIELNLDETDGSPRYTPLFNLSGPVINSNSENIGVLSMSVYLSEIFNMMPDNVFIRSEGGDIVSLRPDGSFEISRMEYDFRGRQGKLNISDNESIHYLTANIPSTNNILLGMRHDLSMFKASLVGLALTPSSLIVLFISLVGLISYLNISRSREVVSAQKTLIHSLAYLAEWRDKETGCHLERTKKYAATLARQLRKNRKYRMVITDEFIEDISDAAPLHDIGKVGVKDSILLKPGRLDDDEFEEMKKHVNIGRSVLDRDIEESRTKQSFIIMGRNICAYHHERYNGKGYIGFKGKEIPLEARIFSLCDAYDAIRADRPYEDEVSHTEAVERIRADRGEHFDPDVVDAFLECENEFLEISSSCEV